MSKRFGSLIFILAGIACGGTTDIDDASGGGSSSGGNGHAGKDSGGSSSGGSSAGKATGGSVSNGGRDVGGGAGVGGTIVVIGGFGGTVGTGGTGIVDPRCPDYLPQAAATCDAGLSCEYDYTGCLCYPQGPVSYGFCPKVDPTCTGAPVPAAAPPPEAGTGGFTTRVALPPRRVCTCTADMWACNYGF